MRRCCGLWERRLEVLQGESVMAASEPLAASGVRSFFRRHQLLVFVVLAYAVSWWPWVWYHMDPDNIDAPILPIGPLIAALIVLGVGSGWPAIMGLLRKVVHWRVGWKWYAVALLL